jgi:hypothetical protein
MESLARTILAACALCSCSVDTTDHREQQIAIAFTQLCEPIHDSIPRSAWTRDLLEVQQDAQLPLSEQDVTDILALAARQGIHEPVLLRSGKFGEPGNLGVSIRERAIEDQTAHTRSYRWLFLCLESRLKRGPLLKHDNEGRWRLEQAQSGLATPWFDDKRDFFRTGAKVWEFDRDRDVDFASAVEVLSTYASGKLIYADGVEPLDGAANHSRGWLGRIDTRSSGTGMFWAHPAAPDLDWDLELEVPRSEWAWTMLALKRVGEQWQVVLRMNYSS